MEVIFDGVATLELSRASHPPIWDQLEPELGVSAGAGEDVEWTCFVFFERASIALCSD